MTLTVEATSCHRGRMCDEDDVADALLARRWPAAALEAAQGFTLDEIAVEAHLPPGLPDRWRRRGLTDRMADRLAVLAGLHPAEVWPSWCEGVPLACGGPGCANARCGRP